MKPSFVESLSRPRVVLVGIREVAEMLACSVKTVRRWIDEDRFLQPLKVPGPFKWRLGDVQGWIEQLPARRESR